MRGICASVEARACAMLGSHADGRTSFRQTASGQGLEIRLRMADKPGSSNYIVIGSKATNVTVSPTLQSQSTPGKVFVTCLPNHSQNQPSSIKKALLKAVCRHSKGRAEDVYSPEHCSR